LSVAEALCRPNCAVFKELNVVLALAEGLPISQTSGVGISGFGKIRPVCLEEISKLDLTVAPDGNGLPAGSGSVSAGAKVYAEKCQSCHEAKGQGGPQDQLTGGVGTIASAKPVKTPVSYWPSATTIFDYVRRAMPLQSPESLTND
jgi:cytochrome c